MAHHRRLTATAQYNYYGNFYRGSYYTRGEVDGYPNLISKTRSTTETRTQTMRDTFTAHLAFNRTFADRHTVSATAGYELMTQRYWYLKASSTGSASDDVPILDSGINFNAENKDQKQALMSFFGRVSYDFSQKYIVSGDVPLRRLVEVRQRQPVGILPCGFGGMGHERGAVFRGSEADDEQPQAARFVRTDR